MIRAAAGLLALLGLGATLQGAAIKQIMERSHKGKDNVASEVRHGRGKEEDVKKLLAEYQAMAKLKPARGDQKSWQTRTAAVVSALEDLLAKKPGAVDKVYSATDCRSCHDVHRPGGNK